jgi:ABC-type sugar transport system permease subunit
VFIAPFLILFAIFGIYPIVKSLILAAYITNGPHSHVYVGFGNFAYLLHDDQFRIAVWNTVKYAFFSVFLQLPLALGLAMLMSQKWLKGREFWRLIYFAPNLVGQVFVAVLFQVLYTPKDGLINQAIHAAMHRFPADTQWLSDPIWVMPAIVITSLWMYVGFNMIYFLAALQAVDKDLYEAATVDGAGAWAQFRHVTLPGIKPVAIFVLITATIGSFQLFELPYILLGNTHGPASSGLTIVMYLYENGFITGDLGYASAVGWTLAVGVLLISLAQMKVTGAWKAND